MDAIETSAVDPELDAVLEHVFSGRPLDPELVRRIHERSERLTQEVYWEHGLLNIGTQLIREARGPLDEEQEHELTLAQRDLLRAGDGPPRLVNPDTGETYILLSEEEYERLRGL